MNLPAREPWSGPPVALFWDQSLVWGLICVDTLDRMGVPYRLLSGEDIHLGALHAHRVLLVPGGWALHKARALGDMGAEAIRAFVRGGGSYLGFCGGAGLALTAPRALELTPVERMPLSDRLPNASGEVWIHGSSDHPLFRDIPVEVPVSIWWPGQFGPNAEAEAIPLARYARPGADFRVADLAASDFPDGPAPWRSIETTYGINLDPDRLMGEPAILETRTGSGTVLLSYPHLETPDEPWGNRLLQNALRYLDECAAEAAAPQRGHHCHHGHGHHAAPAIKRGEPPAVRVSSDTLQHLAAASATADELIAFGERHLLWNWRRPWLLNWRRGVRGLEYGMLAVLLRRALDLARTLSPASTGAAKADGDLPTSPVRDLKASVTEFCAQSKRLLIEEKIASQSGIVPKIGSVNETVDSLRSRLFGGRMNHEGLARTVFDPLDALLLDLLRTRPK